MNTPNPATVMKREDYKSIKRMNRVALTDYLSRIYMRGYKAGQEAIAPAADMEDKQGEVR